MRRLAKILTSSILAAFSLAAGSHAVARAQLPANCAQLANMRIRAASIGLPTGGAIVTASHTVATRGNGGAAHGDYCLASGRIMPVDPWAPDIRFEVALPVTWNHKVVMFGGGGYDGTIPRVSGNALNMPSTALTPLERGYAVFASDSGHQGQGTNGYFLTNQEAYRNWLGNALKKTRDAALSVVNAHYGARPEKSYFLGSSTGGREALAVAARWPADWDGVVALYPGRNVTVQILGMLASTQAFAPPGAFLDRAKRGVLFHAALEACDSLDGVRDGIISDVRRCNAAFKPAAALLNGKPIRCPGGVDTGDTCLSDVQIGAIEKENSRVLIGVSDRPGQTSFPGYNIFTSDSGVLGASPIEAMLSTLALGDSPPTFPTAPTNSLSAQLSGDFIRYAVTKDPAFDQLTFNVSQTGGYAQRLRQLSALDLADTNLEGFAARGGKLLMMQGTADLLVSPRATEAYYEQLQANMGSQQVSSFVRYYEVPGFGHSISADFNASWDQLTALENWVEKGIDPGPNQIVADTAGVPGRTRPLCLYPTWPKYNGSGDVNRDSSFTCAKD